MTGVEEINAEFAGIYRSMAIERAKLEIELDRYRDPADEEHY